MKRIALALVVLVPLAGIASMVGLLVHRLVVSAWSPEERALAAAVVAHDLERVSELLVSGANPSIGVATRDAAGKSSCRVAFTSLAPDRPESIEILALVLAHGCDPNDVFDGGTPGSGSNRRERSRSALEWAAECCLAAVEVVLQAGADPTLPGGARALSAALESRRSPAIARRLIEAGIDLNARDYQGRTPLAVAVGELQRDVVELLESRGATEW